MRIRILIFYLVFLHVALCTVVLKSDFTTRVRNKLGQRTSSASITNNSFYQTSVVYHERIDGNVPAGSVIFIGDSITQGLCVNAVAAPAVNFGIGSDTTIGVLSRLPKYRCLENASAVVLAIGVNDLISDGNETIIKENYRRILGAISPRVPIVISAILPVEETLLPPENKHITNLRIANLNDYLKTLCQADARCVFVDAGKKLRNNAGALHPAFHVGDGVHLNSQGYTVWIELLKHALDEVRRQATSTAGKNPIN